MADETFLEFFNKRRNGDNFQDRQQEVIPRLELEGEDDNGDRWSMGRYTFYVPRTTSREIVAAYAIYVKRQTVAGDEVGEFELPTVKNA